MKEFAWLFPLIFIFHDMEEIVGFGPWIRKSEELLRKKSPRFWKSHQNFSTEGFALAVYEELVVCLFFSALLYMTDFEIVKCLWLGCLLGFILHLFIHIGQAVILHRFIPAVITSIVCLPVSTWIFIQCLPQVGSGVWAAGIWMVIGIMIVVVNLKFALKLMDWYTAKMVREEKREE